MELLELINVNHPEWSGIDFIQDKKAVDLYYSKFTYKLSIRFKCISRARYYDDVDHFKNRLNSNIYSYTLFGSSSHVTVGGHIVNEGGSIDDLCKFIDWKNKNLDKSIKLITSGNYITFYFNEPTLVKGFLELFNYKFVARGNYRLRIPNFEKGVIYLKNPEYKWRLYLHSIKMSQSDIHNFNNLFNNNDVKPCPSLLRTISTYGTGLTRRYARTYTNNFIDYNDEKLLTLIGLFGPQFIKKICRLEQR